MLINNGVLMERIIIDNMNPFTLYKLYKDSLYDMDLGLSAFFSKEDINYINHKTHLWDIGQYRQARLKYCRLYGKRSRIKKDIAKILEKSCLFLTLTFDDYFLEKLVDKRQRIRRWLQSLKCNYIGNVDYGEISGRIHYHVIVQCDNVDYSSYKYGAINGKRIVINNVDALKRYLVKLTNHACKESTKREERLLKCFKYG